ncbi:Thioredoxin and Glutaredoxin domain containing protein [Aphelenchoides besseyi]|nr:Thioredoxin and Glutaredoxin domain containing protein [Aphelenchoides besseyi]KAI6199720.1 Thioredoxin and Glutaredoxin domain containing protein [Aphelenchoides besseyi]
MSIKTLKTKEEFDLFIKQEGLNLVHFAASWAPTCNQLNEYLSELQKETKFNSASLDAEELSEVSLEAKVEAAPTVILYKDGKPVKRLNGFNPTELRNAILTQSFKSGTPAGGEERGPAPQKVCRKKSLLPILFQDLNERLKQLINKSRLTLFMKGSPNQPRCGFSRQIVQMLTELNCDFWTFDILSDKEVRQGLKEYSDGELLGGLDVLREEIKDEEFVAKLPKFKA